MEGKPSGSTNSRASDHACPCGRVRQNHLPRSSGASGVKRFSFNPVYLRAEAKSGLREIYRS